MFWGMMFVPQKMFIFGNQSDIYQLMKVFKFIPFIFFDQLYKVLICQGLLWS